MDTWVRILVKKPKGDLAYKVYKNMTFSEQVYQVKKVTKKTPVKYWVNRKWKTQDMLLKSAPRDQKSIDLVKQRDRKQQIVDFKEEIEKEKVRLEEKRKNDAVSNKIVFINAILNVCSLVIFSIKSIVLYQKQSHLLRCYLFQNRSQNAQQH